MCELCASVLIMYVCVLCVYVLSVCRDYNSLTPDIFASFLLNIQPLIHYLCNAIHRMFDQIK